MTTDKKPKHCSAKEQEKLDRRLIEAARGGHMETVQELLARGANVHAQGVDGFDALGWAAYFEHTEMAKVLLACGANVHVRDDEALRFAAHHGRTEVVNILANHIFAPDSWRGKSRAEIEAYATWLYDKIVADNTRPERLRQAGTILLDSALTCWEHVRPAPPKLSITPLPAQPRPV